MILGFIIVAVVWSALAFCGALFVGGGTKKRTRTPYDRYSDEGWWD